MKKLFLSLVALLMATTATKAEDGFSVNALAIPQGGSAELEIVFESATAKYNRFQLEVQMPEGITCVMDGEEDVTCAKGELIIDTDHTLTASHIASQGLERFICVSMKNRVFPQGKGVVMTATYQADASLPVGTVLTGHVKNVIWNDTENAEYKTEDISFTITIEENDGRIHFNETSTKLPKYTAGEKGNVVMKRTIHANEWSTIVLPFTLTKAKAEAAFGSDVQLAEFTGFETAYADDEDVTPDGLTLNFSTYTMTSKKGLTGGKPFLIRTTKNITEFTADDVTLFSKITDVSKSDEYNTAGKMTGTFVKSVIPADGLFLCGNELWYSTGITNVKAFRAWFELGAVLDKETSFEAKVRFTIDDEPTTIEGIGASDAVSGAVYNMNGQLIGKDIDVNTLPKGIYIVDGKKIAVK